MGNFAAILFILCLSSVNALYAGQEIGNGGDPLRLLIEEGRQSAVKKLEDITGKALPSSTEGQWLSIYSKLLAEDLRESKITWVESLPNECPKSSCACTFREKKAEIFFSTQSCTGKITDTKTAATLLIHEASHHFDIDDETLADRIAILAMKEGDYFRPKSLFNTFSEHNVNVSFLMRNSKSYGPKGDNFHYQGYMVGLRADNGLDYRIGYFNNSYVYNGSDEYYAASSYKVLLNLHRRLVNSNSISSAVRKVLHSSLTPFWDVSLGYVDASYFFLSGLDVNAIILEGRMQYLTIEPGTGVDMLLFANFSIHAAVSYSGQIVTLSQSGEAREDQSGLISEIGINYFF